MATIELVGSGWRVRQCRNGKLVTVATCATKTDAQAIKRRLEEERRARGRIVRGSQLPLTEILKRWALAKVADGNDVLHTGTAEVRLRTLVTERNWLTTASVTALAVSDYRQAGGSPRTCAFLAAVLRWARDTLDQHVDDKALVSLRPGRAGRKPSPVLLTRAQVDALEARAGQMSIGAGTLVHCLSTYGWRPITAARLRVCDFDAVGGTITCSVKGGDVVRHLLLPETVTRMRWLVATASPQDPLFRDPRTDFGWELSGNGISQWSRDHLRTKVYDLKRFAISTMLARSVPPQDVAAFTGHRTIGQVLRYSRSNEAQQRSALDKLGKSVESPLPKVAQGDGQNP